MQGIGKNPPLQELSVWFLLPFYSVQVIQLFKVSISYHSVCIHIFWRMCSCHFKTVFVCFFYVRSFWWFWTFINLGRFDVRQNLLFTWRNRENTLASHCPSHFLFFSLNLWKILVCFIKIETNSEQKGKAWMRIRVSVVCDIPVSSCLNLFLCCWTVDSIVPRLRATSRVQLFAASSQLPSPLLGPTCPQELPSCSGW